MRHETSSEHIGWSAFLAPDYLQYVVLVCLGVWLHAADGLLLATMMPAIIEEIGGAELVAWNVALYEIGTIVTGAAGGLLSIRYGLKVPMMAAAALFAAGCLVSMAAPTMPVVLAGRLLQGIGGGGLMALSFVAVAVLFPERLMPRAMAAVATLWGVSSFLGPLIGGLFVAHSTWRMGFAFFAFQATALGVWVMLLNIPATRERPGGRTGFPIGRLLALAAAVVLIAYGGIDVAPLRTAGFVLAGALLLAIFLWRDGKDTEGRLLPMAPLSLESPHGAALATILCFSIATIAILIYGPVLMVTIHGTSALVAGYIVACSSIGWTVGALLVAGANARHDPKFILCGMLLVLISIFGFLWSIAYGPVWLIAVAATIEGVGFGVAWTFILRRATSLAPEEERERISGALPTMQRLGYALGAAYIGIVANAAGFAAADTPIETATAARWIFLGCVPPALAGLVATIAFVRPRPTAARRLHAD